MLSNYELLPNGVVKQVVYDHIREVNYVGQYNSYGELTDQMSFLRLGLICGVMGVPNSILDFGYGNGSFLKIARKLIPNCYGYDVTNVSVPEHTLKIDDPLEVSVDVITFFDSLEHCKSLSFVKRLKCSHVVISVPECHHPENDQWFAAWKHRRPDEHLWHFNRTSLENFMNDSGYYLVRGNHIEDAIRKNPLQQEPNILTAIFKKKIL